MKRHSPLSMNASMRSLALRVTLGSGDDRSRLNALLTTRLRPPNFVVTLIGRCTLGWPEVVGPAQASGQSSGQAPRTKGASSVISQAFGRWTIPEL
jgi:hypothetical protein